ncbi:MAG: hypothetical protein EOP05_10685 [Proteobacteria bacterium]|nr:MAG: hypothetical protein EOP05_10685 [Pseudomonadota bacterium]
MKNFARLHIDKVHPLEIWNLPFRDSIVADYLSAEILSVRGAAYCEAVVAELLTVYQSESWARVQKVSFVFPESVELTPSGFHVWQKADREFYQGVASALRHLGLGTIVDVGQSRAKVFDRETGELSFYARPLSLTSTHDLSEEAICQRDDRETYRTQQEVLNQWFAEFWPKTSATVLLALPCEVDDRLNFGTTTYLGLKNPGFLKTLRGDLDASQEVAILNDAELSAGYFAKSVGGALIITLGTGVGAAWIE